MILFRLDLSGRLWVWQQENVAEIRLEIRPEDAATLEWMQGKCRALYNWWVMRLRDGEKWPGVYEAKKTLQQSKKKEREAPKEAKKRKIRDRMVYNDWGLYSFVQMLGHKCLRVGKELFIAINDVNMVEHI